MRRSSFVNVELEAQARPQRVGVAEEHPCRILLLGNFGGKGSRRPVLIDRDNFESVMAGMQVQVGPVEVREMDDFHPDTLYTRLEIFRSLRDTRERLMDRSTFQAAAAEMSSWTEPPRPQPAPPPVKPEQLFAEMVEETSPASMPPGRVLDDFDALLHRIVAPHIQPRPDPRQAELVARVDETIAEQMRAILHHPEFQSLEAAWRGLFFLVRRLETGERLNLYVLDVPDREEAVEQAIGALLDQPVGSEPWSLVAANFYYGDSPADLEALAMLAAVGQTAHTPVLAGASPRLLGCESLAEAPDPREWRPDPGLSHAWSKLRGLPEARSIGLALPRFLLRLPYGPETSAIDSFEFEEMPGVPRHGDYLWGNPVFACVSLIGEAFAEYGWAFRPGAYSELHELPAHVYKRDGEVHLTPCAETWMTESAAELILHAGIMPLVSIKGTDRARLLRFQSIADPPTALIGRWTPGGAN